jgi:hypothetical protein
MLVKESQKLEEKMNEMKKKIENEVKITRIGMKKPPRSHSLIFFNKFKKTITIQSKKRVIFAFQVIKNIFKESVKQQEELLNKPKKKTIQKFFEALKKYYIERSERQKKLNEIARRHHKLQVQFNCFNKWQDFVMIEKMGSEDKSYIEEMDTLLDSFIQESVISQN